MILRNNGVVVNIVGESEKSKALAMTIYENRPFIGLNFLEDHPKNITEQGKINHPITSRR